MAEDHEAWMARSRVFPTPIAAPSIMGLFGFTIGAMVLEHSFGRTVIPVGCPRPPGSGLPGAYSHVSRTTI